MGRRLPAKKPEPRPPANFQLVDLGRGRFACKGELSFASVSYALKVCDPAFRSGAELMFDLARVVRADSAGVALLIEWLKRAEQKGASLRFAHVPEQVRAIARVSGLEETILGVVTPTPTDDVPLDDVVGLSG